MRDGGEGSRDENVFPADAYLRALSLASVPVEKRQWYVKWAERFAAFLVEKPLDAADRDDAEAFIASLGRRPQTEAWQVRQATDAVRILLTAVFGKSWIPARSGSLGDSSGDPLTVLPERYRAALSAHRERAISWSRLSVHPGIGGNGAYAGRKEGRVFTDPAGRR
ncbi:MAG: phage integrase N-terminal SAM-like domain-containing protein [Candidatus Deferrimicrobiaceae bacterium]